MEINIYNYLCEYHTGKKNLIKNHELRDIFHISGDKKMRKIIQNIRENPDFPLLVGSISGNKGGYYICSNNDEIEETIANTKHRAKQMLYACDVMERKAKYT